LKFAAAILGVLILTFGLRESSLRSKAQASERLFIAGRIEAAEAATKPRRLTPEQKESLTVSLKAVPQKQKIFISASVLHAESVAFGEDIESVLVAAGFETYFPKAMQPDAALAVGPPGTHIVVKALESPNPVAVKLQRCFMDSGVKLMGIASGDPNIPADRIEIAIGQK
jgi:hypothetical protein